MQLLHQRVAWAVIEMYGLAAVISKLQSMLNQAESNGEQQNLECDLMVGKGYCRHAANRIQKRLKGLFRNQDERRLSVADIILQMGSSNNDSNKYDSLTV